MKTISFPVSLKQLEVGKLNPIDSFLRESANRSKIISIVDGDCVKCIVNHLNALDSVFNSLIIPNTQQVVFVLNVSRKDSAFFYVSF
ncbi:hypothetical protein DMA11_18425 [Marinilabiliaceae bacterium JC017]|nr:hypothetical protein DMA11_18425 [Marinilabiliaceae bacterium JC017]